MAYVSAAEDKKLGTVSVDQQKLTSETATIKRGFETLNEGRTASKDATLKKGDDGFSIEPEVVGDAIDVEQTVADLQKQLLAAKVNWI